MRFNRRLLTPLTCLLVLSLLAQSADAQKNKKNKNDSDSGGGSVSTASVDNPDFYITLPQTTSRGNLGAEINVDIAEVKVELDETKADSEDENLAIREVEVQGDLAAVALDVARSYLYVTSPDTAVATRGISGVGKTSATPASNGVVDGPKWRYDVRVDSFKQYRNAETGEAALAVDASMQIIDETGKPLLREPRVYHDPPLDQRKTDEEIEKEIGKRKRNDKTFGALAEGVGGLLGRNSGNSQNIASAAGALLTAARAQKTAELEANYTSTNTVVKEYQWQEAAVRSAVRSLMDQAPTPSGGMRYGIDHDLKNPKKLKGASSDEEDDFRAAMRAYDNGDQDIAFERMLAIGDTDCDAISYNQAVAELRSASKLTQSNPGGAFAAVDRAYNKLLDAGEYSNDEEALYRQVSDLRKALEPYKGQEVAVAVATTATDDPADIKAPSKASSKFALLIGIGQFEDSNVTALSAAPRDVDTMKEALLKAGFKESNIISLKNEQATLQGIRNAINDIGQRVDESSLLVVAVSSHGSSPADNDPLYKEGFIFCHDSNLDQLFATAYPIIDFREHLDRRIRCQQKIVFQDTCHSGAGTSRLTGTRIEYVQWPAYMAIFAAAAANEVSVETNGNGIFTKTLADYIARKGGKVTVSELNQHLSSTVPKLANDLNHTQNPQLFTGPGAESISLN